MYSYFTTLLVNQAFINRILHVVACRTVATRFANWHFSQANKSNLAVFKCVWQWKLSFGTKWWKYWQPCS